MTKKRTFPWVFINTVMVGAADAIKKLIDTNALLTTIHGPDPTQTFSHDIVVIGGGAGGLAVAMEAAKGGMKVSPSMLLSKLA